MFVVNFFLYARGRGAQRRRNKGRRDFVHQVGAGHGRKNAGDLVQRERMNKGWRDFVHQVAPRATPAPRPAPHHARRPAPRLLIRKFINFRMIIKVY